jgi:DNA-binding transcriptional ArsR family regulator
VRDVQRARAVVLRGRGEEPNAEACIWFLENNAYTCSIAEWSFLTNHARALVCIAHDPGARLRDIAAMLGITERRAFGIVTDLTDAGYIVKERDGRRNRYSIRPHLPLRQAVGRDSTIGELLGLLVDTRETGQWPMADEDAVHEERIARSETAA